MVVAVPLPRRPAVAVAALSAAEIVIEGEGERVESCVAVMLPERELERVKDGDGVALFEPGVVVETDVEGEARRDADPAPPEDGVKDEDAVVESEARLGEPVALARLPVHVCDTLTVELGDARELTLGETVELMLAARVAEDVVVPESLWLRESVSEVVKVGLCVPLRLGLGDALLLRLTRALVLVALGDALPVALGHRVGLGHGEALGLPVPLSVGERVRLELGEAVKEPVAVGHADEERDTEFVPLTHVVAVDEPLTDCVVEPLR